MQLRTQTESRCTNFAVGELQLPVPN